MSGEPFSISSGAKTAQYGANSRAMIVGSSVCPAMRFMPGAVGPSSSRTPAALPWRRAGSTGMGRNMFQGPGFWDMDGSLSKSFQATERFKFTFRVEAFNALNHANFRKLGSTSVGSTSILSS